MKTRRKEAVREISRHTEHQSESESEGVKRFSRKQSRRREKDVHAVPVKDLEFDYPDGSGDGIEDELTCHPEQTLAGHPVTSVTCKESSKPNLTTAAVKDPVSQRPAKEPSSKLWCKPAKSKKTHRKYIWITSVSYSTGRRDKQITHVAAYTSTNSVGFYDVFGR